MGDISIEEARKAMIAKRFGGNAKGAATGGAGSVRRKNKGAHKSGGGMCLKAFMDFSLSLLLRIFCFFPCLCQHFSVFCMKYSCNFH